ncbi:unnamed protein product [Spirodela intermedia]|uniref:Uncharacterized protein n=1 Tax=Spirodela intermedia TaxID=51605 RepID=A0A7I8KFX7_SPIIN|nr:unnamed protein product [Spirodela intermedia]
MANLEQLSADMPPEERIEPSPSDGRAPASVEPSLSRNLSSSRLNAQAPEFVPRSPVASHAPALGEARMVQIHHAPPPPPVMHIFHPPPPPSPAFHHVPVVRTHAQLEYYGGGGGGYRENEAVRAPVDPDPAPVPASAARDGLSDDVIQRVTKQVEYYFSDANLATTEHLMRFINKDPEGFVPISVIGAFKKIKALINNNAQLATALRTSSKLVVSDDGKKVRRQQQITEANLEELQSRIVVAENLPEDHCYQNLLKLFSVVGSVKTIRTCYPQAPNGMASTASRPGKMDTFLGNKLHAFVEFETVEDAEKAVAELNEEKNWRSGLRVRLLPTCMMKHGQSRGRKGGHEAEGAGDDEDASISNQQHEKHFEDPSQSTEQLQDHAVDDGHHDREGGARRGRGRGRGSRGRARGQYYPSGGAAHRAGHAAAAAGGAAPPHHLAAGEPPTVARQPPGPRMPDGTKGFTMGRGRPIGTADAAAS